MGENRARGELLQKVLLGIALSMLALAAICAVLLMLQSGEEQPRETEHGVVIIADETIETATTERPTSTPRPALCEHSWQEGVCTLCGEACPHLRHDADSRICSDCGERVAHSFVNGQCRRCGMQPVLLDDIVDAGLAGGATQCGELQKRQYSYVDGNHVTVRKEMSVYVPYGYDVQKQYPVALLIHGYGGSLGAWMETAIRFGKVTVRGVDVVDRLIEESWIAPVLIVSIDTPNLSSTGDYDSRVARVSDEIRYGVLPAVCAQYSTYAADNTPAGIARAREHFAIIGASDGALYAVESGLRDDRDLFGVFAPLSGLDIPADILAVQSDERARQYPIRLLYMGTGQTDFNRTRVLQAYIHMLEADASLIDGKNAFHHICDSGHNFRSWFTDLANVLQLAFDE